MILFFVLYTVDVVLFLFFISQNSIYVLCVEYTLCGLGSTDTGVLIPTSEYLSMNFTRILVLVKVRLHVPFVGPFLSAAPLIFLT